MKVDSTYSIYALVILLMVYIVNFVDRSIFSILAQEIKNDLHFSDAQLGFLAGTAFILFYTLFGIPLARLADGWHRPRLIGCGAAVWSVITAATAFAGSFATMAICRFGVAAGEAAASPASFSLLSDFFSPRVRATVVAIYGSGVFIGGGLGLLIGGYVVDLWKAAWPDPALAPLGLGAWQAAFLVAGIPGLVLSLLVASLREPRLSEPAERGQPAKTASRDALLSLLAMIPVASMAVLRRSGASARTLLANALLGASAAGLAFAGFLFSGDVMQWSVIGLGVYAATSWIQLMATREPVVFRAIFGCRTLQLLAFGGGIAQFVSIAVMFWIVPFFQRQYGTSASEIGAVLGVGNALCGFIGTIAGGVIGDRLRFRHVAGRIYLLTGAQSVTILGVLCAILAGHLWLAFAGALLTTFAGAMTYGPAVATVNDLVLPRVRATASAYYLLITSFLGGAIGPYAIGRVSDLITQGGGSSADGLRDALLFSLVIPLIGIPLLGLASFTIARDTQRIEN